MIRSNAMKRLIASVAIPVTAVILLPTSLAAEDSSGPSPAAERMRLAQAMRKEGPPSGPPVTQPKLPGGMKPPNVVSPNKDKVNSFNNPLKEKPKPVRNPGNVTPGDERTGIERMQRSTHNTQASGGAKKTGKFHSESKSNLTGDKKATALPTKDAAKDLEKRAGVKDPTKVHSEAKSAMTSKNPMTNDKKSVRHSNNKSAMDPVPSGVPGNKEDNQYSLGEKKQLPHRNIDSAKGDDKPRIPTKEQKERAKEIELNNIMVRFPDGSTKSTTQDGIVIETGPTGSSKDGGTKK